MRRSGFLACGALVLAGATSIAAAAAHRQTTTAGVVAIANLDHQLAQTSEPAARIEFLLTRSRFLGDYEALEEAVVLAESLPADAEGLLSKARCRAAAHRFEEALDALRMAHRMGASEGQIAGQRASILVATGRAAEALPQLEADAVSRPGFASHSALANAYAELGHYQEADREYRAALDDLRTSSPFAYAWIHFARGLMWSEQAGDKGRGETEYAQALAYLPQFVVANIHKAELELGRGELGSAANRIMPIAGNGVEPEALALLGEIRRNVGDKAGAIRAFEMADQRYRVLLEREPLAFADHAAEFYKGPGKSPEQAWSWAKRNLANRATPRAFAIAIQAAVASGRDACGLVKAMRFAFDGAHLPGITRTEWERRASVGVPDQCR